MQRLLINYIVIIGALCEIIVLQDGDLSCFRDIKPGAPHHYLVVPNKHVGNCKSLNKEHVPLGEVIYFVAWFYFVSVVNRIVFLV